MQKDQKDTTGIPAPSTRRKRATSILDLPEPVLPTIPICDEGHDGRCRGEGGAKGEHDETRRSEEEEEETEEEEMEVEEMEEREEGRRRMRRSEEEEEEQGGARRRRRRW